MEPFVAGLRSASGSDPIAIVFEALALLTHSTNSSTSASIGSRRNPDAAILKAQIISQNAEAVVTGAVRSIFWEGWWSTTKATKVLSGGQLFTELQVADGILKYLKFGPPVTNIKSPTTGAAPSTTKSSSTATMAATLLHGSAAVIVPLSTAIGNFHKLLNRLLECLNVSQSLAVRTVIVETIATYLTTCSTLFEDCVVTAVVDEIVEDCAKVASRKKNNDDARAHENIIIGEVLSEDEVEDDDSAFADEAALRRLWTELSYEASKLLLPPQWLAEVLRLLPEAALSYSYAALTSQLQSKLEDANSHASTFASPGVVGSTGNSVPKPLGLRGSTTLSGTFNPVLGAATTGQAAGRDDVALPLVVVNALRSSQTFQALTNPSISSSYANTATLSETALSCMDTLLVEASDALTIDSVWGQTALLLGGTASTSQQPLDNASMSSPSALLTSHSSRLYNNKHQLQGGTPHITPTTEHGGSYLMVGSPSLNAFGGGQQQGGISASTQCRQLHPFLANVLRGAATTASSQQRAASATTIVLWDHVVRCHLDPDYSSVNVSDPLSDGEQRITEDEYYDEPPALLPVVPTKTVATANNTTTMLSPLSLHQSNGFNQSSGHLTGGAKSQGNKIVFQQQAHNNSSSLSSMDLNAQIALLDPMFSTWDDSTRATMAELLFPQIISSALKVYEKQILIFKERLRDIKLYGVSTVEEQDGDNAQQQTKPPIAALLTEIVEFLASHEHTDLSLLQVAIGGPKLFNALAATANHRLSNLAQTLAAAGDKRVSAQIAWESPMLLWKRWLLLPYVCQRLFVWHENLRSSTTALASELKRLHGMANPKENNLAGPSSGDEVANSELLAFESIKKVLQQHRDFGTNVVLPLPMTLLKFIDKNWQLMPTVRQIKETLAAAWIVADGDALLSLAGVVIDPQLDELDTPIDTKVNSSPSPVKRSTPTSPARGGSHTHRAAGFADLLYQFDAKGTSTRTSTASPKSPSAMHTTNANSQQMLQMLSGIASFMTVQCTPSCAVRIVNAAEAMLQSANVATNRYAEQQQLFQEKGNSLDLTLPTSAFGEGIVSHQRLLNTLYQISAHLASTSPPGHLVAFFPLILKTFQSLSVSAELAGVVAEKNSNSSPNQTTSRPPPTRMDSMKGFNLDASISAANKDDDAKEASPQSSRSATEDDDEAILSNAVRQCTIHAESMKALRHLLHHISFRVPELPNEWLSGNALLQCVACYLASTAPPPVLALREEQLRSINEKRQRQSKEGKIKRRQSSTNGASGLNNDSSANLNEADVDDFGEYLSEDEEEVSGHPPIPKIPSSLVAKCNAEAALTVPTAESFLKTMAQHFSSPAVGEHTAVILTLLHHLPTKKVSSMLHIDAAADTADTLSFCERRSHHIALLPSVAPYSIAVVLADAMPRKVLPDGTIPDEDAHTLAATSVSSFSEQTDLCLTISFEVADPLDDTQVPELVAGVIQLYSTTPGIPVSSAGNSARPSSPTTNNMFSSKGLGTPASTTSPSGSSSNPSSVFLSIPLCGNKVRLAESVISVNGTPATIPRVQLSAPVTTVIRVTDSRPISLAGTFTGADGKEVPLCIRTRAQQIQSALSAMLPRTTRSSIAGAQSPSTVAQSPKSTPSGPHAVRAGSPVLSASSNGAPQDIARRNNRNTMTTASPSQAPQNPSAINLVRLASLTLPSARYVFGISKGSPLPNTVSHINDLNHCTLRDVSMSYALSLQAALVARWTYYAMRSMSYRNAVSSFKSLSSSPTGDGAAMIEPQTYFLYLCPGDIIAVQISPAGERPAVEYALDGLEGYISSDDEAEGATIRSNSIEPAGAVLQVMCAKSYLLSIADCILNEYASE